jgi:hypothetical protein
MANLDVQQMNEAFMLQQMQAGMYDDRQAMITGNRASYGDIPAMLMSGAQSAGGAMMGVAQGAGSALSAIGSMLRPITYTPPAHMYTGYYGQYQMQTGPIRELAIMAGMAQIPRGINAYQYGHNAASNLADRAVGLTGGAVSVGAGMAGGYAGGIAGSAIGTSIGAFFGGPIGASIGGTLGGLAGNLLGYTEGSDLVENGLMQRRNINAFLETASHRYVGAGSSMADPRLGGGMSASARRSAVDAIKGMDLRDPTMGMEDLSTILQGATQMGLFAGTRDIDDFKKKFKNIVEGVKSVATTLNTTLEEGLQVMKDFKAIGIDPSQMASIGLQASALGKVAGRTGQEMVGIGLQGAELFRGTGVEMNIGYQANVMNMAAIRSARDAGIISQEAVSQAGGEEAMAQRMTAGGLQFMQSNMGKGLMTAFYGKNGFDEEAFKKNAFSGGASVEELATMGDQNMGDPRNLVRFTVDQAKTASAAGKTFGGRGNEMGQIMAAVGSAKLLMRGLGEEETQANINTYTKYALMTEQGLSNDEADLKINLMKNAPKEFQDKLKAINATEIQQTMDEAYRTTGLRYRWNVMMDEADKMLLNPAMTVATNTWDKKKEQFVGWWDRDVTGIIRGDVANTGYRGLIGRSGRSPLVTTGVTAPIDLTVGGGLGRATVGEQVIDNLKGLGLGGLVTAKEKAEAGDIVLENRKASSNWFLGEDIPAAQMVIKKSDMEKAVKDRQMMITIDKDKALKMAEADPSILSSSVNLAAITDKLQEDKGALFTIQDVIEQAYGDKPITEGQFANLVLQAEKNPQLKQKLDQGRRFAKGLRHQREGLSADAARNIEENLKDVGKQLTRAMGLTSFMGLVNADMPKTVIEKLDAARRATAEGDTKGAEEYTNAAVNEFTSSNLAGSQSSNQVREKFNEYTTGNKFPTIAAKLDEIGYGAREYMVESGGKRYLLANQLAVNASSTVKNKEEVLASLENIFTKGDDVSRGKALRDLDLSGDVGKSILSLPMGKEIERYKQATDLVERVQKDYEAAGAGDKTKFKEQLDTGLAKLKFDPASRGGMVKAWETSGVDQGMAAVAQTLNISGGNERGGLAPGATPGGLPEGSGTSQGSAAEISAQQVNINYEILEALRALNAARR